MKRILVNLTAAILLAITFQSCGLFGSNANDPEIKLFPFSVDGKTGYFNLEGKIVINPQFEQGGIFNEGLALIKTSENKYGFIDEQGKIVINPQFKMASNFSDGLAPVVSEGGKCQYIDKEGKIKLTIDSADACGEFKEGIARIMLNRKYGFIDKDGKVIVKPQFDRAGDFNEGMAQVKMIIQDTDNKTVIPKYGFINSKGEYAINLQTYWTTSEYSSPFCEGLLLITDKEGKCGYINQEGKIVINPQFTYAGNFSNGLAWVLQGEQFGYIDKEGKFVINPQFNRAYDFASNGLAVVGQKNGDDEKYGYIDKSGKFIINPQFACASPFIGSVALASTDQKQLGIIDNKGKFTANPQFSCNIRVSELANLFYILKFTPYKLVESDYSNIHIVGRWKFSGMQSPQIDRMMAETDSKIASLEQSIASAGSNYSYGSELKTQKEMMESQKKMMNDMMDKMKAEGWIEFTNDGRYNQNMSGTEDGGTYSVNKKNNTLYTTDSKGKTDELLIEESTNDNLVLSTQKDSTKIMFTIDQNFRK